MVLNNLKTPIVHKILSGIFWTTLGSVVLKGLAFFATIFVARILAPERFGEFGLVRSTASMFSEIGGGCLCVGTTKYVAELLVNNPQRVGRIICFNYLFAVAIGIFLGIIFFMFAPLVCFHSSKISWRSISIYAGGLFLFFQIFDFAQKGVLAGFQDFRGLSCTNIISAVIAFPMLITGTYYAGIDGAITALALSAFISLMINSFFIYRNLKKYHIQYSVHGLFSEISYLWKINVTFILIGIISAFSLWCPNWMLSQSENGFFHLGIYLAMMQFYTMIVFLPSQLTQIVIPMASTALAEHNNRKFKKLVISFSMFSIVVGLATAALIILLSRPLISLLGSGYEEGADVLPCVALTAVLAALSTMFSRFLVANGKTNILLLITCIWGTIFMGMTHYLLYLDYGVAGVVLALLTAWIIHSVISTIYMYFTCSNQ
jgi:O-antigen/teichoic acid export membrane protein